MRHHRTAFVALTAAVAAAPALAENCQDTGFVSLAAADCRGAFVGNLNGDPAETTALATTWGSAWRFVGKSDDSGNGPFTSNPQLAFSGALVFDTPISGNFIIGLKAADQYSYYLFKATSAVALITFDTTEGVATSIQGNPLALSFAALYVSAVPEVSSGALLLAGLLSVAWLATRRRH